jgi:nucleoside-diphosphate-sugar epimerase
MGGDGVTLVVLGYGYSSRAFVREAGRRFERVVGTARTRDKADRLVADGVQGRVLSHDHLDPALPGDIADATALLVSIPPDQSGDPVLARPELVEAIAGASGLGWIGYLSTVGVYGDHGGAWVDEATPPAPVSERSVRRVEAEQAWLALGQRTGRPVMLFRLAGIYGPGQNALVNLAEGTARRIVKPGQVFNRIHVEDIAGALAASLDHPRAGAVYNVTDDEPGPPQDVVAYAAGLLGLPVPADLPFDSAELSPMARSFYGENKRVSNRLLHDELGYALRYPTYREGLTALAAQGEGRRNA